MEFHTLGDTILYPYGMSRRTTPQFDLQVAIRCSPLAVGFKDIVRCIEQRYYFFCSLQQMIDVDSTWLSADRILCTRHKNKHTQGHHGAWYTSRYRYIDRDTNPHASNVDNKSHVNPPLESKTSKLKQMYHIECNW